MPEAEFLTDNEIVEHEKWVARRQRAMQLRQAGNSMIAEADELEAGVRVYIRGKYEDYGLSFADGDQILENGLIIRKTRPPVEQLGATERLEKDLTAQNAAHNGGAEETSDD